MTQIEEDYCQVSLINKINCYKNESVELKHVDVGSCKEIKIDQQDVTAVEIDTDKSFAHSKQ